MTRVFIEPARISLGKPEFDERLCEWLEAKPGRTVDRLGDQLVLVNELGTKFSKVGVGNEECSDYEDSARKTLQAAIYADLPEEP